MSCSEVINSEAAQTLVVCAVSGFNWVQLVGPGVILISVMVAGAGVILARRTARQKATLDMIEKVESTLHYQGLHSAFSYHRRQGTYDRLHDPQETKDKEERQSVLDYLNHYELVSIGIREKILDGRIYMDWMRGPFVRDWNSASDFIQRERWKWDEQHSRWDYHEALYTNFQYIACRWSSEAHSLSEKTGRPPHTPAGPGDEHIPDGETNDTTNC